MKAFRLALGAHLVEPGRTQFRVWAPKRSRVDVAVEAPGGLKYLPLAPDGSASAPGYFEGTHPVGVGTRYRYRLDGGECLPDPCSRFQPEGPHGPSEVVDPDAWRWRDHDWKGVGRKGQVLYELHVGTFSREGTYEGVRARLPDLKALGVTVLELMPLHAFPGRFNWGYDGVNLFAPYAGYGTPDDLRRLVDEAHGWGLGVILDVVYNHLGPDGNYLRQFSDAYFSKRHPGEWGEPLNLDDAGSGPVRELILQNACYWVSEFHFDGLRLDATQSIFDDSPKHLLGELSARVREAAAGRQVLLIAENEPQDVRCVQPVGTGPRGGQGLDALWVDDFHHSAKVALTGNREAYLQDYTGTAQELVSCVLRNSLFQGQWYEWQKKPRGSPLGQVPAEQVVIFLQNHDQISNTLRGERCNVVVGERRARAFTTFFLLLPQTPMLFMGQEHFATSPFLYFVDHKGELVEAVRKGRGEFIGQFPSVGDALRSGFELDLGERARDASVVSPPIGTRNGAWELHRELLRLRREDPVFAAQALDGLKGSALTNESLVLRFSVPGSEPAGERLVLLNMGNDQLQMPMSEPLLAPPGGMVWRRVLSSEDIRFGGSGTRPLPEEGPWSLPAQCALVLTPQPRTSTP